MTEYRKPRRFFEDAGVVDPQSAFHVELEDVCNNKGQDLRTMIDLGRYFSIFAPRQSGKTTFFRGFSRHLEQDPTYVTILLSFQFMRPLAPPQFYRRFHESLTEQVTTRLASVGCDQKGAVETYLKSAGVESHAEMYDVFSTLNRLVPSKKLVVFIDEFDGIPSSELENFLTTLRELYQKYKGRKDKALYSVGLVGIRDITKLIVGGVSPFNIADQIRLPPFSLKNIRDLYAQYTEETHQPFTEQAVHRVCEETAGQPWLVNRLGTILTVDVRPGTTEAITEEDVDRAVEALLFEENSHFDNITEKAGQFRETFIDVVFDGVQYVPGDEEQSLLLTHGLIKAHEKDLHVSNPIYKRRFTRTFFQEVAGRVDTSGRSYYLSDGSLDMERVLSDFEKYIAQIGAAAFHSTKKPLEVTGKFQLTAWLYQFVAKGGGDLFYERETDFGVMDIMLVHNGKKYIIELKIDRYSGTGEDALEQLTDKYLLTERVDHGYIVLFAPKTRAGELRTPERRRVGEKEVLIHRIAIGRDKGETR